MEKLTPGSFVRNIAILTGGSIVAYGIGLFFTPVITRLYEPVDYGRLSFINSTVAFISALCYLSYNGALILPKSEKRFFQLSSLILFFSGAVSILILLVLVVAGETILQYFDLDISLEMSFIIPVILILGSIQIIAENYNVRKKKFAVNARSKVSSIFLAKSSVSVFGLFAGSTLIGLISGEIIIRVVNVIGLLRRDLIGFMKNLIREGGIQNFRSVAIEYREYPKYIFPSSILLQLATHLPIFIIGKQFSPEMLGYYALAAGLLGLPIQVIGFSLGKVFLQKSLETKETNTLTALKEQTIRFYYGTLVLSSVIYAIIYAFGPQIFLLVAGDQWWESGQIAVVLAFPLIFQVVSTSIGPLFIILRKEKANLQANMVGSIFLIIVLFIGVIYGNTFMEFVWMLSGAIFIRNIIIIALTLKLISVAWARDTVVAILIAFGFFVMFHLLAQIFGI